MATYKEVNEGLAGAPGSNTIGQTYDKVLMQKGGNPQTVAVPYNLFLQQVGQNISTATSVTYSEATTLVTNSQLVPGQLYTITNATAANGGTGSVTVQAVSTTQFAKNGTWIRPIAQKAFGWVYITAMTGGDELSTITVNGVNVLANAVPFNTNIYTTVTDAVAEVSLGGYTAFQAGNAIVLVNSTAGSTPNGHAVLSTGTGTYAATNNNVQGGASGTDYYLSVEYDFTTNQIKSCFDPLTNVTMIGGSIYSFPWGEKFANGTTTPKFTNGTFNNVSISNWYITTGGTFTNFYVNDVVISGSLWENVAAENNNLYDVSIDSSYLKDVTINHNVGYKITVIETTLDGCSILSNTAINILSIGTSNGVSADLVLQSSVINSLTIAGSNNTITASCVLTLNIASTVTNLLISASNISQYTVPASTGIVLEGAVINNRQFNIAIDKTFDGTAGSGSLAGGGAVTFPMSVPNNFFAYQCISEGDGLVGGGGATLKVGIASDDDDAFIPVTAFGTLNAVVTNTVATTKATAVRAVVGTVATAAITAGTIRIWVKGYIGQ